MSRSRAFNRTNRFNAKRKRKSLRSEVPCLQEGSNKDKKNIDNSKELLKQASNREILMDLIEPDAFN